VLNTAFSCPTSTDCMQWSLPQMHKGTVRTFFIQWDSISAPDNADKQTSDKQRHCSCSYKTILTLHLGATRGARLLNERGAALAPRLIFYCINNESWRKIYRLHYLLRFSAAATASVLNIFVFTAQYTIVQSAVYRLHVVRPSVCNVGESGPRRLEILETNCTDD